MLCFAVFEGVLSPVLLEATVAGLVEVPLCSMSQSSCHVLVQFAMLSLIRCMRFKRIWSHICLWRFKELGLITTGAMAEQWVNHLGQPAAEPPAKARAVASNKSELERDLLVLVARLSVKNAADLRLLCSMAYSTLKFEANHGAVKTCEQARSLHADRTRGQSGHKEGQPDEYALVALLLAVKENAGDELQRLIDVFLADHPPKDPKLASAVKVCRVQNMHVSTHKKMFLRLADEHKPLEQALVAALVADGGMQLFGQAPRGSLERKAIDLMQKLGVKNN